MITVSHITKKFGDFTVLSDINFQVSEGEIYGLVGYNGVGKTTLFKIMCGIYRANQGSVQIDNAAIYENPTLKSQCFLMTEESAVFSQATLNQMRKFYKGYYPTWSDHTFDQLTSCFSINPNKKVSQFSKGMQRQANLILAFSTRTKYLFLDEAFDGLDLTMRNLVREMIRYYAKEKKAAILISSHNLLELEELVEHIGMLSNGKLVFDDTTAKMKQHYGTLEEFFQKERKEKEIDWEKIFK
jgi:ABC-2 type transport system ATP-binding protein